MINNPYEEACMAKYSCKACGAELYFDPKLGKLHCDYCGSVYDPSEYADAEPEAEQDLQKERTKNAAGSAARAAASSARSDVDQAESAAGQKSYDDSDEAGDLILYQCPNCGAEMITSRQTAVTTCVYCNRTITLEGNLKGDFHPDFVLPFEKSREDVEAAYRDLCKKSRFAPKLFSREATVKKIKGMYVPYWLYSFNGTGVYKIDATNVRVWRVGNTEYTETTNYAIDEEAEGAFENIPADALKELDNTLMDSIEPFDFSKMVPFSSAYLAGFYTQRWNEDANFNQSRARDRAKISLRTAAMKDAGSYATMHIRTENYGWRNEKTAYAMLPVWMMYTSYRGKDYLFGMNGQTGKIMGKLPIDPGKVALLGVSVFVIVQIICMIFRILEVML